MVEKKSAAKPEPVKEAAPVEVVEEKPAEPVVEEKAAAPVAPEPEPVVHAGGHVLTEDKGWVPEEGS